MSAFEANWQNSAFYNYTDDLVRSDWAWEALRRNAQFRKSWREAQCNFETIEQHGHLRVVGCFGDDRTLRRWGCLYTDPPECNAASATVIWQPEHYARVLPMEAFAQDAGLDAALFKLHNMNCKTTLLVTNDGLQHLYVQDAGHGFQLAISGASLMQPVHLLADAVLDPKDAGARLGALQCFNDLRATGHLVRAHFPAEPASPRLRLVMQALDGDLAGASYRDIAVVLFGEQRVAAEWNEGTYLLDHVRRAVRRGRHLMNGGYLKFLK